MSNIDINNSNAAIADRKAICSASLPFDPARYRAELGTFDLTEAQQHELLLTLWSIMRSFVELGFTADICTALLNGFDPIPAGDEVG